MQKIMQLNMQVLKNAGGRDLNFKFNAHSLRRRWKGRFEFIFVNAYANIITVGTI